MDASPHDSTRDLAAELERVRLENETLSGVVGVVASGPDLAHILDRVVDLLTRATSCHACFVYLRAGDSLRLRAASPVYSHHVGRIAFGADQGLAGWTMQHGKPAFIRDGAIDDPRTHYVPELEEERFQSMVAVPIPSRAGESIGAIVLHTVAPREFDEGILNVLARAASLVAGAIENARLYEEMRRRVAELEHLTELGEILAAAETLETVLPAVASRARQLLRAEGCHLYLLDPASEVLHLRASAPERAEAPREIGLSELGPELARSGRSASVAVPLVANDELLGLLAATGTSEVDLARAVANQTAVALKKVELIERLTEKNLIKDFFEQLARGESLPGLEGRAARLGCDLDQRYVVLAASPPSDELERALGSALPGSLVDRREDSTRALLRVPTDGEERLLATVRELREGLEAPVSIGLSNVCRGAASFAAGFEEARHALLGTTVLQGTPGVMAYEELGAYKYLLRMPFDGGIRDAHRDAVARIAEYDRQRSTALLRTLEEFLRRRGSISATAEALYVHPNTLRQRLRRIGELSGLDLRKDDWLMVEIAVKMVRLQEAQGTAQVHTQRPDRL